MHLTHKYSFKKKIVDTITVFWLLLHVKIFTVFINQILAFILNRGIKGKKNEISFTWHLQSHQENSHKNFLDEHTFSFY